jgi:hypothetical protein
MPARASSPPDRHERRTDEVCKQHNCAGVRSDTHSRELALSICLVL